MPPRDTAARILLIAVALGIAGDLLLRTESWGVNFSIFCVMALAGGLWISKRGSGELGWTGVGLASPILVFGICFLWRDASELRAANLVGLTVSALLLAMRLESESLRTASAYQYSVGFAKRAAQLPVDLVKLIGFDLDWKSRRISEKMPMFRTATRGVILTLPLTFVFGGLLASADDVFRQTLEAAFFVDAEELALHAITTLGVGVLMAALFRGAFLGESAAVEHRPITKSYGAEVIILMAALNILFALFVAVQARYLFGGAGLVDVMPGLTYSEYARRGFFELVVVATLVLPLILVANAMSNPDVSKEWSAVRWLSRVMVAFMFVIITSALVRMSAYVDAYGLTTLRLYPAAFMIWLGLVFAWMLLSTLGPRPRHFAFGAVLLGWVSILGLNVLNPDALMARVNSRMSRVDAAFLASLSADAAPDLFDALPRLEESKRAIVVRSLQGRWGMPEEDWRETNLARMNARRLMSEQPTAP